MAMHSTAGFSLTETVVTVGLGAVVGGTILTAWLSQEKVNQALRRQMRVGALQQRALDRIQRDVNRSSTISATPLSAIPACNLEGRLPVLHLTLRKPSSTATAPTITYSVGSASAPWLGKVLMRCAPDPNASGSARNHVLIDGLSSTPTTWSGCSRVLGTAGIDLAGSAQHPFSACRHPNLAINSVAVRLQLDGTTSSSKSERLINGSL